jgi:hypothetical protein
MANPARAQSIDVEMSHYLVRQVESTANVNVILRTEVVGGGGDGWIEHLVLRDENGRARSPFSSSIACSRPTSCARVGGRGNSHRLTGPEVPLTPAQAVA